MSKNQNKNLLTKERIARERKRCNLRIKVKCATMTIEEKEYIIKRKRESHHLKKCIDNYSLANGLSRKDVLRLTVTSYFITKNENLLVRTNSSKLLNNNGFS